MKQTQNIGAIIYSYCHCLQSSCTLPQFWTNLINLGICSTGYMVNGDMVNSGICAKKRKQWAGNNLSENFFAQKISKIKGLVPSCLAIENPHPRVNCSLVVPSTFSSHITFFFPSYFLLVVFRALRNKTLKTINRVGGGQEGHCLEGMNEITSKIRHQNFKFFRLRLLSLITAGG